jgi:sugar phosphate isomerase/epimerase
VEEEQGGGENDPVTANTMTATISRRRFLGAAGATATGIGVARLLGAEPAEDSIRLGMMLQGSSAAELQERARAIAAAGFDTVQVTFLFRPTAEELQALGRALKDLNLKTAAFGTYFNLFRPDDNGFMGSSQAVMKLVAAHSRLFDCNQFVTWSASYLPQFAGTEARNHTPEAVAQLHRAIREVVLPILEPIDGRVAFEPYFPHVFGTVERAREVLAPFPIQQVGLVLDPPNFITPALYPKRDEEMRRLFRELGDRVHLVHLKDLRLNPADQSVDLPGPGGGEMNYPLLISEIRKLNRPLPCIIEHINAERSELTKARAWIENQLHQN